MAFTNEKKKKLTNLLDELTEYTKKREDLIGLVCGLKDEDMEEFTEIIKKNQNKDYHKLIDIYVKFRFRKGYKSDPYIDK